MRGVWPQFTGARPVSRKTPVSIAVIIARLILKAILGRGSVRALRCATDERRTAVLQGKHKERTAGLLSVGTSRFGWTAS